MKLVKESLREEYSESEITPRENFLAKGRHGNAAYVDKAIKYLESRLSTEGVEVLHKFMKGVAQGGWNRSQKIIQLAEYFDTNFEFVEPTLTKTQLRSYSNTVLFGLIDSGDLIQRGRYLVPAPKRSV